MQAVTAVNAMAPAPFPATVVPLVGTLAYRHGSAVRTVFVPAAARTASLEALAAGSVVSALTMHRRRRRDMAILEGHRRVRQPARGAPLTARHARTEQRATAVGELVLNRGK